MIEAIFDYAFTQEGKDFLAGWAGVISSMVGALFTLRSIGKLGDNDAAIAEKARNQAKMGGWFAVGGGVIWIVRLLW